MASSILAAFFASWRKQPQSPLCGFTFHNGPEYQAFGYVLWLSVLVEIPFTLFMVHIIPALAGCRLAIECGLTLASICALIAVRADRYAMAHTCHQITDDGLHLRLGLRMHGFVRIGAIQFVERIPSGSWRTLSRQWQASGLAVAKLSPLDKPNLMLRVTPGLVALHGMGGKPQYPQIIGLFLDDRERFVRELYARIEACRSCDA
jgi:hypothetical protein